MSRAAAFFVAGALPLALSPLALSWLAAEARWWRLAAAVALAATGLAALRFTKGST